jgi:uncharacterized protein (TIGR02284 family)
MRNEKIINVLNSLITINNDRIEGYTNASEATEENDLKSLFAQFILTSEKCKSELIEEVNKLGGEVAQSTKIIRKFFRVWMDVKAALTSKDRMVILNSCKIGENEAKETYKIALEDNLPYLTVEYKNMISAQKELLKADRKHIKALKTEFTDS